MSICRYVLKTLLGGWYTQINHQNKHTLGPRTVPTAPTGSNNHIQRRGRTHTHTRRRRASPRTLTPTPSRPRATVPRAQPPTPTRGPRRPGPCGLTKDECVSAKQKDQQAESLRPRPSQRGWSAKSALLQQQQASLRPRPSQSGWSTKSALLQPWRDYGTDARDPYPN